MRMPPETILVFLVVGVPVLSGFALYLAFRFWL